MVKGQAHNRPTVMKNINTVKIAEVASQHIRGDIKTKGQMGLLIAVKTTHSKVEILKPRFLASR